MVFCRFRVGIIPHSGKTHRIALHLGNTLIIPSCKAINGYCCPQISSWCGILPCNSHLLGPPPCDGYRKICATWRWFYLHCMCACAAVHDIFHEKQLLPPTPWAIFLKAKLETLVMAPTTKKRQTYHCGYSFLKPVLHTFILQYFCTWSWLGLYSSTHLLCHFVCQTYKNSAKLA